jgi:hypothetical protein
MVISPNGKIGGFLNFLNRLTIIGEENKLKG